MDVIKTISEMRHWHTEAGGSLGFVPTMGALHEGHLSLMRQSVAECDRTAASIFVNPTQFAPHEDLEQYPRPLERDLELCEELGVDAVFVPNVEEIYPLGAPACEVNVPALAAVLEGASRPHFFAGVCRVVAKLLNIVQPNVAYFGRKDYQQQAVVRAMAADLCMPVRIETLPTVRERDGLAMSSRNVYLSDDQRKQALGLSTALRRARQLIEEEREHLSDVIENAMAEVMHEYGVTVDYAVVRHPLTLMPLETIDLQTTCGIVALVAGRAGQVRLIDNDVIEADR